jgi:hypothetical protein
MKSQTRTSVTIIYSNRLRRGLWPLALPCLLLGALAAPSHAIAADSPSVVIQGTREDIQQQADHFVKAAVVHEFGESLMRWDTAVCPLVAGLPRDAGEFVLQRISQAIRDAGAPLAPEKCTANFFVILSSQADRILAELRSKRPGLFDTHNGPGGLQHFMMTQRPVRVWYNWRDIGDATPGLYLVAVLTAGAPTVGGTLGIANPALLADWPTNRLPNSRLTLAVTKSINTAIIIVDRNRVVGVNMGQLSDYAAMVGLAQINLDRTIDSTPSVLRLFNQPSAAPVEGMSPWDRALLRSLYGTRAQNVMQVSEMGSQMAKSISTQQNH